MVTRHIFRQTLSLLLLLCLALASSWASACDLRCHVAQLHPSHCASTAAAGNSSSSSDHPMVPEEHCTHNLPAGVGHAGLLGSIAHPQAPCAPLIVAEIPEIRRPGPLSTASLPFIGATGSSSLPLPPSATSHLASLPASPPPPSLSRRLLVSLRV